MNFVLIFDEFRADFCDYYVLIFAFFFRAEFAFLRRDWVKRVIISLSEAVFWVGEVHHTGCFAPSVWC